MRDSGFPGTVGRWQNCARSDRQGNPRSVRFALCRSGARGWNCCRRSGRHQRARGASPSRARARAAEGVRHEALASPQMEGRRGAGGRKAAAYLVDEFRRLELEPLFRRQYVQAIPAKEPGRIQGRNVGAVLGADPALATSG